MEETTPLEKLSKYTQMQDNVEMKGDEEEDGDWRYYSLLRGM